jgi:predicted phosphodiesterase
MRYGIFSDVHSNLEALDQVALAYGKESIDRYLCAGDVVGYAANPDECVSQVKSLGCLAAAGNHDWASAGNIGIDNFNSEAGQAVQWTRDNLNSSSREFLRGLKLSYTDQDLILVHGSLNQPEEFYYMLNAFMAKKTFDLMSKQVCFLGHSHIAGFFILHPEGIIEYRESSGLKIEEGCKYIVNVGSVGQPRDGDPRAAYCVYDTEKKTVEVKRVAYDIDLSRDKIIKAGLPLSLANRLLLGN